MPDRYFEDHELGDRVESHARSLTEADIVNFAGVSGDFHPAIMDRTFHSALAGGGDGMFAHGLLVFSVTMGLAWVAKLNTKNVTYGFERLRFPRPVRAGDTLRVTGTVTDIDAYPKRPQLGRVVMRIETINQREEIVFVCDHVMLVSRRDADA